MAYYNTTKEDQSTVAKYLKKADSQDNLVLGVAQRFDVFNCWTIYDNYPTIAEITSIRRSIDTLKKDGKILPTGRKVVGKKARKVFEYKVA